MQCEVTRLGMKQQRSLTSPNRGKIVNWPNAPSNQIAREFIFIDKLLEFTAQLLDVNKVRCDQLFRIQIIYRWDWCNWWMERFHSKRFFWRNGIAQWRRVYCIWHELCALLAKNRSVCIMCTALWLGNRLYKYTLAWICCSTRERVFKTSWMDAVQFSVKYIV